MSEPTNPVDVTEELTDLGAEPKRAEPVVVDDSVAAASEASAAVTGGEHPDFEQLPEVGDYAFTDSGEARYQDPWQGEPDPTPTAAVAAAEADRDRVRRARLRLTRIDPWSVMKTSLLFSVLGGIILWVSVAVLWGVVDASGVFDSINQAATSLFSGPGQEAFEIQNYLSTNKVLGMTALLAVLDVVILTAIATLVAFLYNLSTLVLGGIELTFTED